MVKGLNPTYLCTIFRNFSSDNPATSTSEEWRVAQEEMLRSYLATAQSDLRSKQVRSSFFLADAKSVIN